MIKDVRVINVKILNNLFNNINNTKTEKSTPLFEKTTIMGNPLDTLISSSGVKPEQGLKESLRELKKQGMEPDKKDVVEINNFLKNTEGSLESKIQTVSYAAQKGVEPTEKNLTAIHSALNEEANVGEMIKTLADTDVENLSSSEAVKEVESMDLPKDVKAALIEEIKGGKNLKEAMVSVLNEKYGINIKMEGKVIHLTLNSKVQFMTVKEALELFKNVVQIGSKFGKQGIEAVKDILISDMDMDEKLSLISDLSTAEDGDLLSEIADKIFDENSDDVLVSDDMKSNENTSEVVEDDDSDEEKLIELLERLESALELDSQDSDMQDDMIAAQLSAFMADIETSNSFKMFLVKEVTEKIIEVKEEFSKFKIDIRNDLDQIIVKADSEGKIDKAQASEIIEKAIEKFDSLIMKSDITLYTSMKSERDLVRMSSDLAEARNLVSKGDYKAAVNILKNVKGKIESMKFDPSALKVEGHIKARQDQFTGGGLQNLLAMQKGMTDSGRNVMELMRTLGINHEYEVSEKLFSNKDFNKDYDIKDNVKMALLKIMNDDKSSKNTVEAVEKTLNNLTGQQLLNKINPKNDQQTMVFNIPIQVKDDVENLKLYIGGKDKQNALDWENCSMYFVIETKKFGMTGIKLDIKDKQISINLRNDDNQFQKYAEPLVQDVYDEFKELGLKLGSVSFRRLTEDKINDAKVIDASSNAKDKAEKTIKKNTEGFDFKI